MASSVLSSKEFWSIFHEVLFDKERLSQTSQEVCCVLNLLNLPNEARILDLACGFGRHSYELAQRGFWVTGVDINEAYIKLAQEKAYGLPMSCRLNYIKADMREFCQDNSWDAILSLYSSFGYFDDLNEDQKVLENAYCSLKKTGKVLLDLPGKELIARDFLAKAHYKTPSGAWFICEREPVENWGKLLNRWFLINKGKEYFYEFEQRLFSAWEISLFLHQAGFKEVEIYGNWQGAVYDQQSERLIAIGRKI